MADPVTGVDERLRQIVRPYVEAEGVELDDLEVRGHSGGRLVRVTVDAGGGIGIDRIGELSRGLSRLLDESDPVAGGYTLEVSSPGLERVLRLPQHFEKAVGREVDVRTSEEFEGARRHRGVLEGIEGDSLRIVVDGSARSIPMKAVARAQTIFRWEKSPKPGGKRGTK